MDEKSRIASEPYPVDILLLTWNGRKTLPRCLASVRKNSRRIPYRILMWDNGSTDGTFAWLARQKDLIVFRSQSNLGISKGLNQLLRKARSRIVIRLDDDTIVPSRWMERLLKPMEDPSVAVVGCKFVTPGGQLRATEFMPPFFPAPVGKDGAHWQYTRNVEAVGGPCCALRVEALRKIRGFSRAVSDQEDVDLCLRLRQKGYKIVCVNRLAVVNRALNRRQKRFISRNRQSFWKRWSGFEGFPRKDSHDLDRRYLFAWRSYRKKRFRQVLRFLKPVAGAPLREYGVQFLIALAYRALGDLDRARRSIRELVHAGSRTGLMAEGMWALEQGDQTAARKAVKAGLFYFPKEPAFYLLRARLVCSRSRRALKKDFFGIFKRLPVKTEMSYTDQKLGIEGVLL